MTRWGQRFDFSKEPSDSELLEMLDATLQAARLTIKEIRRQKYKGKVSHFEIRLRPDRLSVSYDLWLADV